MASEKDLEIVFWYEECISKLWPAEEAGMSFQELVWTVLNAIAPKHGWTIVIGCKKIMATFQYDTVWCQPLHSRIKDI